ncbi:hypothetical protein ACO0LC_10835 [Undibacterium sp. JH2W]|uniref:hypothetical protein n=1 Tax=Undibacterium sp. JH2W TaxID=3413037 RepID=UPI003BF11C8E
MKLEQLSAHDLRPIDALYFSRRGPEDLPAIHIRLHSLEQDDEGDKSDISIRLDHIPGLAPDPRSLAGRSFRFAINPANAYIDGSVYLQGRHHAVDVTALHFKAVHGLQIPLEVEACILLEEQAQPLALRLNLPLHLPLDQAAMLALLEAGVQATKASNPKDLGRLMAYLKQHVRYDAQLADVATLARARLQAA